MKSTTYATLLGLALALAPTLRAEDAAAPVATTPAVVENVGTQLDASFAAISETIKNARLQASEAVGQRDEALAQLKASRQEQAETAKALEEARKQLAETRGQLNDSRHEQAKWKHEAETLAGQLKLGEEAHQKLLALRDQMQESLKNFSEIEKNVLAVRAEFQKPTAVADLKTEIVALKAAGNEAQQQISEMKGQIEKGNTERAEMAKASAAKEQEMAGQIAAAKEEAGKIAESREALNQRTAELEKAHAQTVGELKSAREELKAAQETIASNQSNNADLKKELEAKAEELKKSADRTAKMGKALDALQAHAKEIGDKLNSVEKSSADLKNTLHDRETKINQLETQMKEVSQNTDKESEAGADS
ncbi:hypothetical protein JIN85_15840 [Luteolibacter pohnpeiensis]|uniref:Chromosome partition protein Smc n=1 Tax=Luteolibacter pohnpeiensis TaxID=454153 RepID=A0A934S9L0_9BACT|nr:hypothetical protein [Luteolibacter pohnpeiensis]MBK1883890.1 hypothetical protein [Luteolibacter pohnpeiensis]